MTSSDSFDTTLRPQDDFFGYVNNPWLKANPIPAQEVSWGSFYVLRDNAADAVRAIIDELSKAKDTSLTHDQRLIKDFFHGAEHFAEHETSHRRTIASLIANVDAITTPLELAQYLGKAHRRDQSPLWTFYNDLDDKNSRLQIMRLHQSGLSLPNRDYYLDDDQKMQDIRRKFEAFYQEMHELLPELGTPDWQTFSRIERTMAEAAWTNVELRDVAKNYNRTTLADLRERYTFDWDAYFSALGWLNPSDNIVIGQPTYMTTICDLLTSQPLDDIKVYLRWRILDGIISWINPLIAEKAFSFFGTVLTGATEIKPLWKRTVLLADSLIIGEIVGREYAQRHFPEASKRTVLDIVEDIRRAYHARIDELTWMGDATKQRAHTKLDRMRVLIGYPNTWKDFSKLSLDSSNMIQTLFAIREFDSAHDLGKIGLPPDPEEWFMNAHTVNAYHHPNRLEIVFPAAILQPPFYDAQASYAANMGGIGAVVGHEFTHGFDDQGADFDEDGNTNRWQTPEERERFDELSRIIVEQADSYETVPGTFLQGKLILGEAIADIGGLALATTAYSSAPAAKKTKDGMRDLFVNFARCECGTARPERLIQLAKIDPHPPSPFRVNCVVPHNDEFYEAYDVKEGDKLYLDPGNRARIW